MNKQFPQPISLADSLRSTGYCVQEGDLPQAVRVMAAAFGDDPSIRYLLGGEAMGRDDWRYFLTVLRAVYDRCVLLSTDETVQDLLVLFPPELQTVPAAPFFLRGGVGLCRFFGPALQALDARHAPLYLETHKAVNTRIYEHLGFHMADISVIPGTETTQYAMLRGSEN